MVPLPRTGSHSQLTAHLVEPINSNNRHKEEPLTSLLLPPTAHRGHQRPRVIKVMADTVETAASNKEGSNKVETRAADDTDLLDCVC